LLRLVPPALLVLIAWRVKPWEAGLPPPSVIPAAIFVAVFNQLGVLPLKAARWRLAFRERPSFLAAWAALLEGMLAKLALGTAAGELMRAARLRDRAGGMSESLGATVAERISEGLALALLAVAAAALGHSAAPLVAAATLVALFSILRLLAPALRDWLQRWPTVAAAVDAGLHGVRPGRVVQLGLMSLASWAVELVLMRVLLVAAGLPADPVTLLTMLVAANLAVIVPLAPANVGPLEAGLVGALVLRGATAAPALGFAITYHLLLVVPTALMATIVYLRRGPSSRAARTPPGEPISTGN
jgi:uncharacterized membrane protein YbhN (UPF0104 family)